MEKSPKRILISAVVIIIVAGIMLFIFLTFTRQLQQAIEIRNAASESSAESESTDIAGATSAPWDPDFSMPES